MSWAGVGYRWEYGSERHYVKRVKRRLARAVERGQVVRRDGTVTGAALLALFESTADCCYCGQRMAAWVKTLDHRTPISRGGVHGLSNLHVICGRCNTAKGTRTHDEHVIVVAKQGAPWVRV